MDGVSYARVLRGDGALERKAFFNYFPHGRSPGRAGGVWVRSSDWKLIRWFGNEFGDDVRFELYNLRDDLSETQNLAATQSARVKELNALIDGFLTDTGATYPRPNPAYQPASTTATNPNAAAPAADPLEGWKARQCEAVVKDGVLTLTSTKPAGTAFLGHGMGRTQGPVVVKLRVRSPLGGEGQIEWLGDPQAGAEPQAVLFTVPDGDWHDLTVDVPAKGLLGTMRLYLPASDKPLDVDWVEFTARGAKPQRWEFNAK
jgi:hypothetical protein